MNSNDVVSVWASELWMFHADGSVTSKRAAHRDTPQWVLDSDVYRARLSNEPTVARWPAEMIRHYEAAMERVATTPAPAGQKYPIGATVVVLSDRSLRRGSTAKVAYTYAHAYGGTDVTRYALTFADGSTCAWFDESELLWVEAQPLQYCDVCCGTGKVMTGPDRVEPCPSIGCPFRQVLIYQIRTGEHRWADTSKQGYDHTAASERRIVRVVEP